LSGDLLRMRVNSQNSAEANMRSIAWRVRKLSELEVPVPARVAAVMLLNNATAKVSSSSFVACSLSKTSVNRDL
jgi:hypothetical protein